MAIRFTVLTASLFHQCCNAVLSVKQIFCIEIRLRIDATVGYGP